MKRLCIDYRVLLSMCCMFSHFLAASQSFSVVETLRERRIRERAESILNLGGLQYVIMSNVASQSDAQSNELEEKIQHSNPTKACAEGNSSCAPRGKKPRIAGKKNRIGEFFTFSEEDCERANKPLDECIMQSKVDGLERHKYEN